MARKGIGQEPMGKETIYSNIWEVAFLVYSKIPFLRTEMQNGKVVFVFSDNPKTQSTMQEFIMNPEVRLQEYIGTFQRMKNLIYQVKNSQ